MPEFSTWESSINNCWFGCIFFLSFSFVWLFERVEKFWNSFLTVADTITISCAFEAAAVARSYSFHLFSKCQKWQQYLKIIYVQWLANGYRQFQLTNKYSILSAIFMNQFANGCDVNKSLSNWMHFAFCAHTHTFRREKEMHFLNTTLVDIMRQRYSYRYWDSPFRFAWYTELLLR